MRITTRFVLVLVVLVLSLAAVGGVGLAGLQSARDYLSVIHQDNVVNTRVIVDLRGSIDETQEQVLELMGAESSMERQRVTGKMVSVTFPAVEVGIAEVIQDMEEFPDSQRLAQAIESDWARFRGLWGTGRLSGPNPELRSAGAEEASGILQSAEANVRDLLRVEGAESEARYLEATASYAFSVRWMIVILILGLVLGAGALIWLIRSVLPRMLTYSRVARRFADGDFSERLDPRGTDEIDQLGRTIDEVASRREKEERYETAQSEFTDVLQLTGDEGEAQGLLKRHLERSITGFRSDGPQSEQQRRPVGSSHERGRGLAIARWARRSRSQVLPGGPYSAATWPGARRGPARGVHRVRGVPGPVHLHTTLGQR
jgi:hypothetical protein